ncbi:glycosyltransferase [Agrobacterium sp. AGB01]|uniref:glycosyltransferase family 2 protein n=1 Tax=Agrobacterium sp. AGB01 TaxID=2769302 RepID=UPI00177D283A|nr:glycosyltransferase [Agrobacterium sp. AGB01]
MRIAIVIPCFNEAVAIKQVITGFREVLPEAEIYVYDNNSTDETVAIAAKEGAVVRHETRQGKGHVVRRMLSEVDADYLIMVDGDATYDPAAALDALKLAKEQRLDFVNIRRVDNQTEAYRPSHRMGNWAITEIVSRVFGRTFTDILSGYKVISRRFAKSFPSESNEFEIETELAIHCLELNLPAAEVVGFYRARPEGSHSKLHTFRDGTKILMLIGRLVKDERPFAFFGTASLVLAIISAALGISVAIEFLATGLVPRLPTAVLSAAIGIIAVGSFAVGLVLDQVARSRREMKRLFYLNA